MDPKIRDKYQMVIGLEIHTQLLTKSKVFAADTNEYGSAPNSNVSAITLGHPGTLPRLNKRVVDHGISLGLAVNSDITHEMIFARKNYFYADLPKGYQITQDETPICTGGYVTIKTDDGSDKRINITRIHIEEDAGKSMHDLDIHNSLVDLNRAGVPLLEIVSEPEIRSSQEAYNYLTEIRKLVRYLDICDGNMEEGSMRCDANISVMLKGAKEFGQRAEVKNMNSIRNVARAIEHEVDRQIEIIEAGGVVEQETRNYDAATNTTSLMRSKEDAMDYRYFPEPDLQPLIVSKEWIEEIRQQLPPLPQELFKKYAEELGLSEYDAGVLTDSKEVAFYFEEMIAHTKNYKAAANWLMGPVKSWLNQNAIDITAFPVPAKNICALIALIDEGKVSNNLAEKNIFPKMTEEPDKAPEAIAQENDWLLEDKSDEIRDVMLKAIAAHPEKVAAYKNGNKNLLGLFMGEVMRGTRGKADPKEANQLVRQMLEEA